MAIYHLSMKPISRSSGRSSVAAAAYRSGGVLTNERDGVTHDFTKRRGVEHSEIVIASGSGAEWALDRSALWNAAEVSEKRKDARVAREFEIALPHELSAAQRLELTRQFAQALADRHGTAVDFAVHAPHGEGDERNYHAHLMMTTRALTPDGLGDKTNLERENKWLSARGLPLTQVQLVGIREAWEQVAIAHLSRAGLDQVIDSRSHAARGIEIEPTLHMGVHATQMERRGKAVSQRRLDPESARRNAELIREKPEQVLSILTGEKSVFDRRDIARALHRYIDDAEAFQDALAKVMASPALVELQAEQKNSSGRVVSGARYSTQEMVAIERGMGAAADRMVLRSGFGVDAGHVESALAARLFLAEEQREAVRHVTGGARIAAVVGLAGAGKSTMLAAARQAWERQGFSVHGGALSGKAAEGLEESSGIASRTLASWEHGWAAGRGELGPRDVLVIDEAGMVSSKQLAAFIGAAERAGAKLVLVGDPEQLQPIGAGAAFRAVAERIGFVELEGVRRQQEDWQRAASQAFARHRTVEGLAAYARHGAVQFAETRAAAADQIVRDALSDMAARPQGSRIVLAHRRADVFDLNQSIRAGRQARGELLGERAYATHCGERSFAAGDRIIFLENNRDLGVKNGMVGTVELAEDGRLTAQLDASSGQGRRVSVSMADYAAVDHGYATTIHKSQGATVDRAFVLASETMDRHLTYVAMTRHRDGAALYASRDEFADLVALSDRLSRSQAKETTLDYAERRGVAGAFGVQSEIEVLRAPVTAPKAEKPKTPESPALLKARAAIAALYDPPSKGLAEVKRREKRAMAAIDAAPPGARKELRAEAYEANSTRIYEAMKRKAQENAAAAAKWKADAPARAEAAEARAAAMAAFMASQGRRDPEASPAAAPTEAREAHRAEAREETFARINETMKPNVQEPTPALPRYRSRAEYAAAVWAANEKIKQQEREEWRKQLEKTRLLFPDLKPRALAQKAREEAAREAWKERVAARKRFEQKQKEAAAAKREAEAPARAAAAEAQAAAKAAALEAFIAKAVAKWDRYAAERKAAAALEAERPEVERDLPASLQDDPAARRILTDLQRPEREIDALAAIAPQVPLDPTTKAERLAARWNEVEQDYDKLDPWKRYLEQKEQWAAVEARMNEITSEIGKDPEMDAVLWARRDEFGIGERRPIGEALRKSAAVVALEGEPEARPSPSPGMSM